MNGDVMSSSAFDRETLSTMLARAGIRQAHTAALAIVCWNGN